MNNILVIGAGRSSSALINYLLEQAPSYGWFITVADADPQLASNKLKAHPNGRATWLDVMKRNDRRELIERADVVVSLLPAHLHLEVAHDCIQLKKHLITSSYVSKEMYRLGDEARNRELHFMGEMGLDPGLEHMSARKKIDEIKANGGKLIAFRSYSGGLIAPESLDNPWKYKFTWNPRNVVLEGQGTAQFLENGKLRYIPYQRLFESPRTVDIMGAGTFEMYPNRDSLLYRDVYGLAGVPNVLRGTLRYQGFCAAWNALIKIGLTNGHFPLLGSAQITYHEMMDAFAGKTPGNSVKERVANLIGEAPDGPVIKKLEWLGLFRKKRIDLDDATPALILEHLLLQKWRLKPKDKDLVLMQHEFEYELAGVHRLLTTTLSMKGENAKDTAMSRLVGLPMAILVKMVMQGQITSKGVDIPVKPEVYQPILEELSTFGLHFEEKEALLTS